MLIIDSGGVSRLAERSTRTLTLIRALHAGDLWPPIAPTVVLVESLQGHSGRDATTNRFLKTCVIEALVTERTARRAAELRRRARHGSAVDAIVVALAEPGGTVLTGDKADIEALATHAHHVTVDTISEDRRGARLRARGTAEPWPTPSLSPVCSQWWPSAQSSRR